MAYITRSYHSYESALDVVDALKSAGFPETDISLISNAGDDSAVSDGYSRDEVASSALIGTPGLGVTDVGMASRTSMAAADRDMLDRDALDWNSDAAEPRSFQAFR